VDDPWEEVTEPVDGGERGIQEIDESPKKARGLRGK